MFTGIINHQGQITEISRCGPAAVLRVGAHNPLGGIKPGDSINTNGVCLTAREVLSDQEFLADVMSATLSISTLGTWEVGKPVNLETGLRLGDPLGGHLVQGHVDGIGEITAISNETAARRIRIQIPEKLASLVVNQGAITIDGVSLTLSAVAQPLVLPSWIEVSLIPETLKRSTLGQLDLGDRVNLETDLLARHVQRIIDFRKETL